MAEKRMFSMNIIDSDAFMDLPLSAQSLYMHLAMRADDDGFVNSPKKIQRMIGATDGDARALVQEQLIIPFESGVVCVKHWLMHNTIRKDRHKVTTCIEEKNMLQISENGSYFIPETALSEPVATEVDDTLSTNCQPSDNQVTTNCQHRLDKIRLDKSRRRIIDNISLMKEDTSESDAFTLVFKEWEKIGMAVNGHTRDVIDEWIQEFETEWILEAIRRADERGHRTISYVKGILESFRNFGGIDDPTGKGKEQSEAAAAAKKKKDAEAERQKRLDELYESYEEADDGTDSGGADTALRKLKGDLA